MFKYKIFMFFFVKRSFLQTKYLPLVVGRTSLRNNANHSLENCPILFVFAMGGNFDVCGQFFVLAFPHPHAPNMLYRYFTNLQNCIAFIVRNKNFASFEQKLWWSYAPA